MPSAGERFRDILSRPGCTLAANIFDPLLARIAHLLGYEVCCLSGSVGKVANLGIPDMVLSNMSDYPMIFTGTMDSGDSRFSWGVAGHYACRYQSVTGAASNLHLVRCRKYADPGSADRVLRRIGRLADGWCPHMNADANGEETIARIHQFAREAGRDPATLSGEGRIWLRDKTPAKGAQDIHNWQRIGATHLVVESHQGGLTFPDQHLAALRRFKDVAAPLIAKGTPWQ